MIHKSKRRKIVNKKTRIRTAPIVEDYLAINKKTRNI
jgi:hypothetical protein